MRAGGRQGEGERSGERRDMDENAPLRAETDMIMGEPLVVVHHSAPPPDCCASAKLLLIQEMEGKRTDQTVGRSCNAAELMLRPLFLHPPYTFNSPPAGGGGGGG